MSNKTAVVLAGLAAAFALYHKRALAGGGVLTLAQVRDLARETVNQTGFNVSVETLVRIAWIESHFDPSASRYEAHLGDASSGLMQTLLGTARWLAKDMGYTAYGVPSMSDLMRPEISMYFGAAYLNWLSRWKNRSRSQEWVIRSYNGGPNNMNSQTASYWAKFNAAKNEVG